MKHGRQQSPEPKLCEYLGVHHGRILLNKYTEGNVTLTWMLLAKDVRITRIVGRVLRRRQDDSG